MAVLNNQLVFSRQTTAQGYELWKFGTPPSGVFDWTAASPLAIFNNPEDDDIYFQEVSACPNYFPGEGCATIRAITAETSERLLSPHGSLPVSISVRMTPTA